MSYPLKQVNMITQFKSNVRKVNKNLTGYFKLPSALKNFKVGDSVQVIIRIRSKEILFFSKIVVYVELCIYIPKNIVKKNKLIGKKVIIINQIRSFENSIR